MTSLSGRRMGPGSRSLRWVILCVGALLLVATSPTNDQLRTDAEGVVGPEGYALVRLEISREAVRKADVASLQISWSTDVVPAGRDGGVASGVTLTRRPDAEGSPRSGDLQVFDVLDGCSDAADCVVVYELAGAPEGAAFRASAWLRDDHDGGLLCGSPGEFPPEATLTLTVE